MPPTAFKAALQDAKKSLAETTQEAIQHKKAAADADARIIQLRRAIVSLSVLCDEPAELETMGLTDTIRKVMKSTTSAMDVKMVKNALAAYGFDLATQKNADASISTVLARLAEAKEIRRVETMHNTTGKTLISYLGPKAK